MSLSSALRHRPEPEALDLPGPSRRITVEPLIRPAPAPAPSEPAPGQLPITEPAEPAREPAREPAPREPAPA